MKKQIPAIYSLIAILIALSFMITACGGGAATATPAATAHDAEHEELEFAAVSLASGEKLKVVATTNIIADVIERVGGDRVDLTALVPQGADPHTFEPTPRDVAAVSAAHVVFANGAGLEEFLGSLLESAGATEHTVYLAHGIELYETEHDEEGDVEEGEEEHAHEEGDPHLWTDPNNVMVWVDTIQAALEMLDPEHAAVYEANAEAYTAELETLDAWIRDQVAQIPPERRRMVTDHQLFAYFTEAYGFEQVGAVIPAYSTMAEPSAKELAALEDAIRELDVRAVFVGSTVNSSLAQRVAEDTGTRLVPLYTGSLSEQGGPADTYIDYMRYNVQAIVDALK